MFLLPVQFLSPQSPQSLTLSPPATGTRGSRCWSCLLRRLSHCSPAWLQVFSLRFHPRLHQNLPDHVPKAWDSKTLPGLWSFSPPAWAGLGSWPDFRDGNLDVVCQEKCPGHSTALQVIPSSSCVTPMLALSLGASGLRLHRAGPCCWHQRCAGDARGAHRGAAWACWRSLVSPSPPHFPQMWLGMHSEWGWWKRRSQKHQNSPGNGVKEHLDSLQDPNPKGTGVSMATWPQPSADSNIPLTQNSSFSWIHQPFPAWGVVQWLC